MASQFTEEQIRRYARHIVLPQVGGKGQSKLLGSRVFVVGAGGLGSPVLLYLAAAGVGTIEVIDPDAVDESNLQRQVIHNTARVGTPKVDSAADAISALNPDIRVIKHQEWLTPDNAMSKLREADLVLDGSDNFATRYLVNDAAFFLRKPHVFGAMFRFEGQVTVFSNDASPDSPCYRCLFPEPPPADLVPTCQEAGILGCVPGVIGSLMASEAIKLLLGIGEVLTGRLLIFDALASRFRTVRLRRNIDCPLNGDAPVMSGLGKYEHHPCSGRQAEDETSHGQAG